jgi:transcriptional regulator with XRE-family HTH domain
MSHHLFGEKLRQRYEELGLSQREAAEAIVTNQSTISDWVNDKHFPKSEHLLRIRDVLRISIDYLIDDAIPVGQHTRPALEEKVLDLARTIGLDEAIWRLLNPKEKEKLAPGEKQVEVHHPPKGRPNRRRSS